MDSSYLIFGQHVVDDGTGNSRCAVYRIDAEGSLLDRTEWDVGSEYDFSFGFIDPIGNRLDSGYISAVSRYNGPVRVLYYYAFEANGDLINSDTLIYQDPEDSVRVSPRATRCTADGGMVVCGWRVVGSANSRALLLKVDSTAQVEWSQIYAWGGGIMEGQGVAEYVDGGYVLSGARSGSGALDRSFLIRTDSMGDQIWRRYFGGDAVGYSAVRSDTAGNIFTWSMYKDPAWPFEWYQVMLRKWDAEGEVVWESRTHYYFWSRARDFEILPDGSFITSGGRSTQGCIAKFSAQGDSLWTRILHCFSPLAYDELFDVEPTTDGGFVLTGNVIQSEGDPSPGLQTLWVIKTDSLGCVIPGCQNTGVQEYLMDLQALLVVSPNPASDVVNISLALPENGKVEGRVSAQLLDGSGRLVLERSVQQNLNQLRATIDVRALPSGTYYLHLRDARRWLAGSKVVVDQ